MATNYGHFIQRHGIYQNIIDQENNILADELVIADSGVPDTGVGLFFKPSGGNIERVALASEIGESAKAIAEVVPDEIAEQWDEVKDHYAAEKGALVTVGSDLWFLCNILEYNDEIIYDWLLIPDETTIPSTDNLVPKSRTIAGIDLQDDITTAELAGNLGLTGGYVKISDAYTNPSGSQLSIDDAIDNNTIYRYHTSNDTVIGTLRCVGLDINSYKKIQIRELGGSYPEISYRIITYSGGTATYGNWTQFASTDYVDSAIADLQSQIDDLRNSINGA